MADLEPKSVDSSPNTHTQRGSERFSWRNSLVDSALQGTSIFLLSEVTFNGMDLILKAYGYEPLGFLRNTAASLVLGAGATAVLVSWNRIRNFRRV